MVLPLLLPALSLLPSSANAADILTDRWAAQVGYRLASFQFSQIPTEFYEQADIYPTDLVSDPSLSHGAGLDYRWWSANKPIWGMHVEIETLFTEQDSALFCQAETDPCPSEALPDTVSSSAVHGMARKTFEIGNKSSHLAGGLGLGMSDLQIVSITDGVFGERDSWISTVSFQTEFSSKLTDSLLMKLRVRQQLADFLVTPYSIHVHAEGNVALTERMFLSASYGFERRGMDSTIGDISTSTLEHMWHGARIGLGFQAASE